MNSEVQQWLVKALEDYRVAQHELVLPETDVVTTAVCFHCQQFVEKVLKAFLVAHQRDFPRTHDLGYLKSLCAQIDHDRGTFFLRGGVSVPRRLCPSHRRRGSALHVYDGGCQAICGAEAGCLI
jgi:hypothetical protein